MSSFEDSNNPGYDDLIGKPVGKPKDLTVKFARKPMDTPHATSVPSFEETNNPGYDDLIRKPVVKPKI